MNILVIGHYNDAINLQIEGQGKSISLNYKNIPIISTLTGRVVNKVVFLMPKSDFNSATYDETYLDQFQFQTTDNIKDMFDRVYVVGRGDPFSAIYDKPSDIRSEVRTLIKDYNDSKIEYLNDKKVITLPAQSAGYKRRSYKSSKSKKRRNNTRRYKKKSSKRRSGKRV